ncbi:diacylglycerol O-acyltransferase 2 isoform X3 [Chrysemys picta bellii]|uniref:diacylglycerol O-acyltransferase 2 isoform X3 n=1 Tax=Chrysemys picta bellii TaxID=8478 RepID=UPI0032B2C87F
MMKTIIAAYSGVLRVSGTKCEWEEAVVGTRIGTGSSILSALQDLSWLSKSKVEKQLQIISVLQWVLTFLVMGVACTVILMYILCTDCWVIAAVYLAWLVFDWNTPKKGGRRSQWVRNWAIWRYFRDYFPVRLVKTHNLLTNRNYIFGYHPHGIMGLGAFCNFSTEATGVGQKFPGIRPYLATLAGNFRMPILRDYLMSGGICPVNRDSIDYILSKNGRGNAIVIVVGGAAESLNCTPGKNSVTLKNRKGFVKLALRHGFGPGVFVWRERGLQAGDLRGGLLGKMGPEEVSETHRFCSVHIPWPWPFLFQHLGIATLFQAHHHCCWGAYHHS